MKEILTFKGYYSRDNNADNDDNDDDDDVNDRDEMKRRLYFGVTSKYRLKKKPRFVQDNEGT